METDLTDLIETAKDYFIKNNYPKAESLLNQIILKNGKSPEVFHMLGTIYYDRGKFNKAIRSFKRALEIDPSFTDASVGLSIILNDLGRYDEGQKIFEEAQVMMAHQKANEDPYINEKLAIKHDELGELYYQYGRHREALEQYFKAVNLNFRIPETTMKVVECYAQLDDNIKAKKYLNDLIQSHPSFLPAKLRLGQIYYDSGQVPEAVDEWEKVLERKPNHSEALRLIKQAQSLEHTRLTPEL